MIWTSEDGGVGEMLLAPELMPDVIEGQEAVTQLDFFPAPVRFVYAEVGQVHIDNLITTPPARLQKPA